MKRCVLHVGFHKTGTSSLQRFLASNRPALLARGILSPEAGCGRNGNYGMFAKTLWGESRGSAWDGCVARLEAELAEKMHDTVVISAESMLTAYRRRGDVTVPKFFQDRGYEVTIVVYVRNQPQLINSRYTQRVKSLSHVRGKSFPDFFASGEGYRYDRLLDLQGGDWNVVFRPYNQQVRRLGVEPDFVSVLLGRPRPWNGAGSGAEHGLDLDGLQVKERANVSDLGPVAIEAARRVRETMERQSGEPSRKERGRLRKHFDRVCEASGLREEPFCGLTTEFAREIEAAFRDSNDAFARAAWDASWAEVFQGDVGREFTCNDLRQVRDEEKLKMADEMTHAVLREVAESGREATPKARRQGKAAKRPKDERRKRKQPLTAGHHREALRPDGSHLQPLSR